MFIHYTRKSKCVLIQYKCKEHQQNTLSLNCENQCLIMWIERRSFSLFSEGRDKAIGSFLKGITSLFKSLRSPGQENSQICDYLQIYVSSLWFIDTIPSIKKKTCTDVCAVQRNNPWPNPGMITVLKLISFESEVTQFQTQLHEAGNNLSGQERISVEIKDGR